MREDSEMTVVATITTSVDGYITGPDDGPAAGLGIGGERLHYWVFGGPWSYDDHEFRPEEQPEGDAFVFVDGVEKAIATAVEAAGDKDVSIAGGADVIRQALAAGLVDELSIIVAPVILGGGKRLFDGFTTDVELEHLGVRQSPYATFIDYRVKR